MNITCNSTWDQTMYICCSEHTYKCPCGWIRKFLKLVLKTNTYKHLTVTLLHTRMNICSGIPAIDGSTSGSSLFVCLWDLLSLSADFLLQTKSYALWGQSWISKRAGSHTDDIWTTLWLADGWNLAKNYHTIACVMQLLIQSHHTDLNQLQFLFLPSC